MYADDLILLSPSICELQLMVDKCCDEVNDLDLRLNTSKSVCIRIGPRSFNEYVPVFINKLPVHWCNEIIYLGVTIVAGSKYRCSLERMKSKFYGSFNAIYSQLGKLNSPIVTLNLVSSIALPCLLYTSESMPFSSNLFTQI